MIYNNYLYASTFSGRDTVGDADKVLMRSMLYRRLYNIAINNFEWKGLPEPLQSRQVERILFSYGTAVFCKGDKDFKWAVLPCAFQGDLNLYYEPTDWTVYGYKFNEPVNDSNGVYIRNNLDLSPSYIDILWYVRKIAEVQDTIDMQLQLHKVPTIFSGTKDQQLTLKNFFKKKKECVPCIVVDDELDIKKLTVNNANIPYIIDKLEAYKETLMNEVLTLYSFNNANFEKQERLLVDEVNANNEAIEYGYAQAMLDCRKEAAEKMSELYGSEISVTIRRNKTKNEEFYEARSITKESEVTEDEYSGSDNDSE